MVEDSASNDALPLLAFALSELWGRFGWAGFRHVNHYANDLGGIEGCLNRAAERALPVPLDSDRERTLRRGLFQLVRISEEGLFARRSVHTSDLSDSVRAVLDPLIDGRLLNITEEQDVEVAHEALFRAWTRFREWLDASRDFLMFRERLRLRVGEWQQLNEARAYLLQGELLQEARRWHRTHGSELTERETRYIALSTANARGAARWKVLAGTAVLILALLVGVYFLWPTFTWGPYVGGEGGRKFLASCNSGSAMVGVSGYATNSLIFGISPVCAEVDGQTLRKSDKLNHRGSRKAEPFRLECASNSVVVGAKLRRMEFKVDATYTVFVQLECSDIKAIGEKVRPVTFTDLAGSKQPLASEVYFECPTGKVVSALRGRAGQFIDALAIGCRRPDVTTLIDGW